jgi:hypothetical protein
MWFYSELVLKVVLEGVLDAVHWLSSEPGDSRKEKNFLNQDLDGKRRIVV